MRLSELLRSFSLFLFLILSAIWKINYYCGNQKDRVIGFKPHRCIPSRMGYAHLEKWLHVYEAR